MSDYEQAYAALYEYRATGLDGDVQFYVEEAQRAGSPVMGHRFVVWDTREYDAEQQVIRQ